MKSTKCVQCGFVGWADVQNCKACGAPLQQHSHHPPLAAPVANVNYAQWDVRESPKQGLAIFGLILGIVSVTSCGLMGISSITGTIVSWVAMKRAKREPWRYGGQGMATAGFVLNLIMLILLVPLTCAIVIPNLLAARRAANDASARASMRTISSAEITYQSIFGKFGTLHELAKQNLIDEKLATGMKNGYIFRIEFTRNEENLDGYAVTAVPVTEFGSSRRSFYIDETQVMRVTDNGGPASKRDRPIDSDYDDPTPRRADYRPQTVY